MSGDQITVVALDAYGVNPGDLDWGPFHSLGRFSACPRFSDCAIEDGATDAEALLVDNVVFDSARFRRFPHLRYLGLFSTGYDQVDLSAARNAGVAVTHVPDYSTTSVAQLTMAMILNLAHRVNDYNQLVHTGGWRRNKPMTYISSPLTELAGKSLAILGFGTIGTAVAVRARAFGMEVLGWSERQKVIPGLPVRWLPWEDLLGQADVVSLHFPLTPGTTRIIDEEALSLMKNTGFLINTSRGGLVDDAALASALSGGFLGGAGLDVLGLEEPPEDDNPLLKAPNCIITPHIAWATREARQRCIHEAATNLESFLSGGRRNRLD